MAYLKTVSLADGERICWHVANTIRAQLHYLDERDGVALKALLRKCCDPSYQFILCAVKPTSSGVGCKEQPCFGMA